jgi:hypothetical protein
MSKVVVALVSALVAGNAVAGYSKWDQSYKAKVWGISLARLTADAENQFRRSDCKEPGLQRDMEKYSTMSDHGAWCGVMVADASAFNRA